MNKIMIFIISFLSKWLLYRNKKPVIPAPFEKDDAEITGIAIMNNFKIAIANHSGNPVNG